MIMCSSSSHNRLRLMRPCLSFLRQRARAPSTIQICLEQIWTSEGCPQGVRHGGRTSTTAMLSVAGTRWRKKSGVIIASPGEKSGLYSILPSCRWVEKSAGVLR